MIVTTCGNTMRALACALLCISAWSVTATATASAQQLTPKRALTLGPAPGCDIALATSTPVARRDNVEARRLAAVGQEAALLGDQTAAREAFLRAAALNPGDERVAYDLARAHEELADAAKAASEYCRYLTLSPAGSEAADVRARLLRLVPAADVKRAQDVQVAFRLGLALFDDGRFDASARAFDDVVRNAPGSAESFYNRGLARAAAGRRADAIQDLEQFRAAAATLDDRVAVGRAIEVLRKPVYNPSVAFVRGLLPSFGQFYTSRPVFGVAVLVAVASASGMAFAQTTTVTTVPYVDPNGVPAPYTRTTSQRPYFTSAVAAAVTLSVGAALEAVWFARRSQRGASIVARRGAAVSGVPQGDAPTDSPRLSVAPLIGTNRTTGFQLRVTF